MDSYMGQLFLRLLEPETGTLELVQQQELMLTGTWGSNKRNKEVYKKPIFQFKHYI